MTDFATKAMAGDRDVVAPDGSDVRLLLGLDGGGVAHFQLAADATSVAVRHRTVEEIWYFLSGEGEMWRRQGDREQVVAVHSGICITLPLGTEFQFRSLGDQPLQAVGVTMPPWPGGSEAIAVNGPWPATVPPGP
jgi:mannose-6-phosphate isomerase-like protein (cupin superfamily)